MKVVANILTLVVCLCTFSFGNDSITVDKIIRLTETAYVADIVQDSLGFIWIGSEEGILKHNSKYYKVYNTNNGLPESLSNRTNEIFIDSKNNIWAGLEKGICIYNKELDKFDLIQNKNKINPSLITSIDEDFEGNIWIGAFNGIWKYNLKTKELNQQKFKEPIETLVVSSNNVFFGTEKGLFYSNLQNFNTQKITLDSTIKSISNLSKIRNTIYAGTKSGIVFSLDLQKFNLGIIVNDFKYPIKDIIEDDKKNIYVATDGDGIFHLNSKNELLNHSVQNSNNPSSISSNGVYDLEYNSNLSVYLDTRHIFVFQKDGDLLHAASYVEERQEEIKWQK